MRNLAEIDDKFIDEYIFNHRNNLGKPTMGGTDWRFADIIAPSFKEVLEIAKPQSVLEIGFNAGGSALMFLSLDPMLRYHSIDIARNDKSVNFLKMQFYYFCFFLEGSEYIAPGVNLYADYDLVFIDGNHSKEGVIWDIDISLKFKPKYILLDDYKHPSHSYIETIVTEDYKDKLEVVKVYEFNQCWSGYSMALCKVKK